MDDEWALLANRSMPGAGVIPVLDYPDLGVAVEWLTEGLGFVENVRIGDHRVQLSFGDGAVVLVRTGRQGGAAPASEVMLRVADVDEALARAVAHGASVDQEPADFPYGERQAGVTDPSGHRWTLSQSVSDVAPEEWGGTTVTPR